MLTDPNVEEESGNRLEMCSQYSWRICDFALLYLSRVAQLFQILIKYLINLKYKEYAVKIHVTLVLYESLLFYALQYYMLS